MRVSVAAAAGVVAVCSIAFFLRLGSIGIMDLDEGLYAAVARSMEMSGDCVTPRVNGEPFYEKPPLVYWQAAACIRLFGTTEWAVRLPSALAATACVVLTFLVGTHFFGRSAGVLAASSLALGPVYVAAGRLLTTDASLTLWLTIACLSWFGAQHLTGGRRAASVALFWLACGMGVLAKGLPGIVLPWAIGLVHTAITERSLSGGWHAVRRMHPVLGLIGWSAIVLPWHVAALRANDFAFVDEYLIRQQFGRFRGGDTSHHAPFWFFVPGFLAGLFPWSLMSAAGLFTRASGDDNTPKPAIAATFRTFLRVWFWVVLAVFSVSGSKLISYILPLYPAAALIAGDWGSRALGARRARRVLLAGACAAAAMAGLAYLALVYPEPVLALIRRYANRPVDMAAVPPGILRTSQHLVAAACVAPAAFAALLVARKPGLAAGALTAGMTVFIGIAATEGLSVADAQFNRDLHGLVRDLPVLAQGSNEALLFVGSPSRPSTLFYVPRTWLMQGRSVPTTNSSAVALAYLARRSGPVLTDGAKAAPLIRAGAVEAARRGKWVALIHGDDQ